jgi:hypothetical protein
VTACDDAEVADDAPYRMSLSLNVLNHLGLNLYSNVPAVLSEAVANAYDADAETVRITVDTSTRTVTIQDDGSGMTRDDINQRFLHVGYQRRKDGAAVTPVHGRPVMGRKGIGKLSLFSVAGTVEVHTARGGERHALRMRVEDIKTVIERGDGASVYYPETLDPFVVDFDRGTCIVLRDLKKQLVNVTGALRQRLARRFAVLGTEYKFALFIDGTEVTYEDRAYYKKLQYVWAFGSPAWTAELAGRCPDAQVIQSDTADLGSGSVTGWIGTVREASQLKDDSGGGSLNKIGLIVRGKLAHEDLLEEVKDNNIYQSYLLGEIQADYLDDDDREDIATSSRQRIIEDDPRYEELLGWLRSELASVARVWTQKRNEDGARQALLDPTVKAWFSGLGRDTKMKAERLFGKINQMTVDDEAERRVLFSHCVLAFETLRYKDSLDALDGLEAMDLAVVAELFKNAEDIEAAMYHQIVTQRLKIIETLDAHIGNDALERVLQEHLFDHLWLLDPSWERATDRTMEEKVGKAFKAIDDRLTPEQRSSRIDIRYKRVAGTHVIVELKRHSVSVKTTELVDQVSKYRNALEEYLQFSNVEEPVEVVCVVGRGLGDWANARDKERSLGTLRVQNMRVVTYEELLKNSRAAYGEFLDKCQSPGIVETSVKRPGVPVAAGGSVLRA